MKTNLENTVKKQLKDRELHVSDRAWEKLCQRMDAEIPTKNTSKKITFSPKKVWIPISIAASMLLFFTLYFGNQNQNSVITPHSKENLSHQEKVELNTIEPVKDAEEIKVLVQSNQDSKNSNIEKEQPIPTIKETKIPTKKLDTEIVLEKDVELKENKIEILEPKIELALQADSVKKKEKVNYVDPEMLLYSIENNQSVKQNNSDSRLVIIDFNK